MSLKPLKDVPSLIKTKFSTPIQISPTQFVIVQQKEVDRINVPVFNICIFNENNNTWQHKNLTYIHRNLFQNVRDNNNNNLPILYDDESHDNVCYDKKTNKLFIFCCTMNYSPSLLISINLSTMKYTDISHLLLKMKNKSLDGGAFSFCHDSKIFIWARSFLTRLVLDPQNSKFMKIQTIESSEYKNINIKCIIQNSPNQMYIVSITNELLPYLTTLTGAPLIETRMMIHQYDIDKDKFTNLPLKIGVNVDSDFASSLQTASFCCDSGGRYIIMCPNYNEFIHIYDIKNATIFKSNVNIVQRPLQIHVIEEIRIICMRNHQRDNKLVHGFINSAYRFETKFENLHKLPIPLIRIIILYFIKENLHILFSGRANNNNSHLKINIDDILCSHYS